MPHVIAKQAIRLRTEAGEHHLSPAPHAQHVPDEFTNDPYYAMCVEEGHIVELKPEPKPDAPTAAAEPQEEPKPRSRRRG